MVFTSTNFPAGPSPTVNPNHTIAVSKSHGSELGIPRPLVPGSVPWSQEEYSWLGWNWAKAAVLSLHGLQNQGCTHPSTFKPLIYQPSLIHVVWRWIKATHWWSGCSRLQENRKYPKQNNMSLHIFSTNSGMTMQHGKLYQGNFWNSVSEKRAGLISVYLS